MRKKITVAIAAAALSLAMAVPAMAQWNQVGTNWQWVENGTVAADKWVTTANGQYYINKSGVCATGWINWNGNWYLAEVSGANLGNIVKNTWANVDGKIYFLGADGKMATGTQTINGVTYTFDASGACTTKPSGVNFVTITTKVASTTGTGYLGGNSAVSDGGLGSGTVAKSEAEKAAEENANKVINATEEIENKLAATAAVDQVEVKTTVSGSETKVAATVKVNAAEAENTQVSDLFADVNDVIAATGVDVEAATKVVVSGHSFDSYAEAEAFATDLLQDITVSDALNTFNAAQNITLTLADGSTMVVNVVLK